MLEIIKNLLFVIIGVSAVTWLAYSGGGWQELAEKYKTNNNLPRTFLVTENQRINFSSENKSSSIALDKLGIGVLDDGLYLSSSGMFVPLNFILPTMLIPWSDIAYRKIAATNSSNEYYTFYLGNPRIARFSLNAETINKLEQDYGEPIFRNRLGEPE